MVRLANDIMGSDRLPVRSRITIDFKRLDLLLDNLFLVEAIDGGDYYFKYYGELMPVMSGINLCGKRLSEISHAGMRRSLQESYDCVVAKRVPVYFTGDYVWPHATVPIERLLVPMLDDDGAVAAICGLSVTGNDPDEIKRLSGTGPATLVGRIELLTV